MRGPDHQPPRLGPRGARWFDCLLTVVLTLPALIYIGDGLIEGIGTGGAREVEIGLLGAAQTIPLWWRRRHPVAVFALVAAASGVQALLIGVPIWSQAAFPIATYSVARYAGGWPAVAALAIGLAGAVVASVVWLGQVDGATTASVSAYVVAIGVIELAAWACYRLAAPLGSRRRPVLRCSDGAETGGDARGDAARPPRVAPGLARHRSCCRA